MRNATPFLAVLFVATLAPRADELPPGAAAAPPPARSVPGITAVDTNPDGCASCHRNTPEVPRDVRLSTALKRWADSVDATLLAKATLATPSGATLKGKHPPATESLNDIPAACIKCHKSRSRTAPQFSRLMHVLHLTGGNDNHFMTVFQGECTHCHKVNLGTGEWSIPSGPEK